MSPSPIRRPGLVWATVAFAWLAGGATMYGVATTNVVVWVPGILASVAALGAAAFLVQHALDDEETLRVVAAAKLQERKSKPRT